MKTLMTLLMTCVVVGMMSASAMAGGDGGGAKDDGTIVFKNNTPGAVLLVSVGTPVPVTITALLAQGAQFVGIGGTAQFSAAAGNQTVNSLALDDATAAFIAADSLVVSVVKQQTTSVSSDAAGNLTQP